MLLVLKGLTTESYTFQVYVLIFEPDWSPKLEYKHVAPGFEVQSLFTCISLGQEKAEAYVKERVGADRSEAAHRSERLFVCSEIRRCKCHQYYCSDGLQPSSALAPNSNGLHLVASSY